MNHPVKFVKVAREFIDMLGRKRKRDQIRIFVLISVFSTGILRSQQVNERVLQVFGFERNVFIQHWLRVDYGGSSKRQVECL